jgi:PTH1 family peptidyl-tRNA hydrolase
MILIVGLGNPGERYKETRHNLGFMVLEKLAKKLTPLTKTLWEGRLKFKSEILVIENRLVLVKPQTFMNESGKAVERLASFYKIDPENLWVVHDDVDLPLGKIKIRLGGASAGHHGVESIIEELRTDNFYRFRLGVGHPREVGKKNEVETYILKKFESQEQSALKTMVKKAVEAIEVAFKEGMPAAMSRFNN